MDQKNKRIFSFEDVESRHAHEVEQLESRLRVSTQQGDESKKKLLQAEVKIRQLTGATLKDMKQKVKEKNAEIEVLKEMVKSANTQIKAKDTDINRLKKRLQRLNDGETVSNYGGSRRGNSSSRHSRLGDELSHPRGGNHIEAVIPEQQAQLEETGNYQDNPPYQQRVPKSQLTEWEEAVELDKMLEKERNSLS